jgi:hypothetical protein
MESKGATNLVKKLEYTPLPTSVQNSVINALNGTGTKSACLQ